jgi:uncharacterized protein YqfA (UPF0365 family)
MRGLIEAAPWLLPLVAEAQVPLALAEAFRAGQLGVMAGPRRSHAG